MVAITYFVAIVLITSETREVNSDLARFTEHSRRTLKSAAVARRESDTTLIATVRFRVATTTDGPGHGYEAKRIQLPDEDGREQRSHSRRVSIV
jgi:hypothetical protein